jgi:nucleoid-associated protein YgaU
MANADRAAQDQLSNLNELSANNDRFQTQVKDLTAQLAAARSENARLATATDNVASLRNEVAGLRAKLADSQKSVDVHAGTVAELTETNDKLAGEKATLEKQVAQLRDASEQSRGELADLRARMADSNRAAQDQLASVNGLSATNERLQAQVKELSTQLASARVENARLAQSEQARQDAEQRAANLAVAAGQLAGTQRDLAVARTEIARLNEAVQALDRDRTLRVTQLQQENAAVSARLRQAQGTLDQIASAARILGTSVPTTAASPAPVQAIPVAAPAAARTHVVAEGDSLTRISIRYYGSSNRWQDIYEANRDVLQGENALRPGQRLRIP